mgnify:CR=1 FL=1
MRESCANDKTVTKYFDICSNVIIHWYGNPQKEREFKGKGEQKEGNRFGVTMGIERVIKGR